MNILLADFSGEVGREDILKPTKSNEGLYVISNGNWVSLANRTTSKSLIVKKVKLPQKYIQLSH
jgi:hypothetical protein